MSYEDYFDEPVPTYDNDLRLATITITLLGAAAVVSVMMLIWAVLTA